MQPQKDTAFECLSNTQRRLLEEFRRRGVRFMVIGGYAVRFYGHLRPAHDLDLVVDCAEGNLQQIKSTLEALGARRTDAVVFRLRSGARQIVKWNDMELWSSNSDRSYDSLVPDAVKVQIAGVPALLISKADLTVAKREATRLPQRDKRDQDETDVAHLTRCGDAPV